MRWKLLVLMLCTAVAWSAPALAQSPESSNVNAVDALSVEEADDGTYIRIQGSEEATFSVFKLDDPPRLFVDLSNSTLAGEELSEQIYNGVISEVGVIDFEDGFQEVARLVVGFEEPAHYDVRTDGNEVVVFIDGADRQKADTVAVDEEALRQRERAYQAQLNEARQQLQETEQRYQDQAEQRQRDYDTAVGELESTQQELSQARQQLDQMRQRHEEASGQERQQLEASIAEQSSALETARQQVEQREAKVDKMQAAVAELESDRDEHRARYEEARKQADRAEEAANQARAQAQEARESERQAHLQVDELEQRLSQMDSEVEGAESRIVAQRQELESVQARAEQLEAELAEARQQEAQAAREVEAVDEAAGADQQELERLQEERQQLQAERERELEKAQRQARMAQQRVDEAIAEREEWHQARQDYKQQLAQAEEQTRKAEQDKQALSLEIAERDEEIERLQRAVEQADTEEEKQRLSDAIAQRDAEIERLQQEIPSAHPDAREAKAVAVDPSDENSIQAVRLETNEQGISQIVVDLDRPGQFTTSRDGNTGRSVMILNDVDLPAELERTLSSDGDGGVVRFVSSYKEEDGSVRMEADVRGETSEVIRQEGRSVVWEFAPELADAEQRADGSQEPFDADEQPKRPTEGESVTSAPPNYPRVVSDPTSVNRVPGMGTRPITIDLRNADIENVLRLISSESGVNIIAGDDVGGNVTMRLQGVPMDEAFLTVLQSLQLGFEIRGNVLRVAPQGVLNDEEEARAEARARAQQQEPLEVFLLPVNYASAGDLTTQVDGLLSPRGSVSVDARTNTLIIKDLADNLDSIRMLIETLDAQVPQVLIEARIVETNENFDREVGIQWGGDFAMSQGGGNPTGLIFPNVLGVSGGATDGEAPVEGTSENPNYAVNLPAAAGTGAGGAMGLTMGSVGGTVNLNMRLSAMESAGYAKIISSPRILTLDNREATISQGTSIPISVVSAAGVQTIFVDATLELTVTPQVTPDGNVQMAIQATKNEPDFQNTGAQGDPSIIQNQAQTELLVQDGDTTVIGGIYTENTGESFSGVPFLHRIPILGFLFRSHSEMETRSELLIFITPRIVNRAEALGVISTGEMGGRLQVND